MMTTVNMRSGESLAPLTQLSEEELLFQCFSTPLCSANGLSRTRELWTKRACFAKNCCRNSSTSA